MPPRSPTTLPLVEPIVPVLRSVPFDDPAWLFEPKYHGFSGAPVRQPPPLLVPLEAREHHDPVPGTGRAARDELRIRSAILDGEIVSLDEEGRQIFRRMLAGRGHLHYAGFDLLWLNGRDLRSLPLRPPQCASRRPLPAL